MLALFEKYLGARGHRTSAVDRPSAKPTGLGTTGSANTLGQNASRALDAFIFMRCWRRNRLLDRFTVGLVVIGRNEGERLVTCLESVIREVPPDCVVYVDSAL